MRRSEQQLKTPESPSDHIVALRFASTLRSHDARLFRPDSAESRSVMLSTARPPAKLAVWHTPQALTIHARQKQEKDFGAALIALENEDHCRRVAIRTAANLMSQNRLRVKHKDNVAQGEKSMKASR